MEKIDTETARTRFKAAAEHIKAKGFRVFIHSVCTYGYYSNGRNVAYFQENEFAKGVNVATVNKTPGSSGRHLAVEPHLQPVKLEQLTVDYLKKGFQLYPDYFPDDFRKTLTVIKFANLEEFLAHPVSEQLTEI